MAKSAGFVVVVIGFSEERVRPGAGGREAAVARYEFRNDSTSTHSSDLGMIKISQRDKGNEIRSSRRVEMDKEGKVDCGEKKERKRGFCSGRRGGW